MDQSRAGPKALASVVVPWHEPHAAAQRCMAALARHTRAPWELIAAGHVAEGESASYLAGLADARAFSVTAIARDGDSPSAIARGLAAARGAYLAVVDPQAVVADGWLDQLAALANSAPDVGVAGPMSNAAAGDQNAEGADYADLDGLRQFASRWRARRLGTWSEARSLSGPCVLLTRQGGTQVMGGPEAAADLAVLAGTQRAAGLRPGGRPRLLRPRRAAAPAAAAHPVRDDAGRRVRPPLRRPPHHGGAAGLHHGGRRPRGPDAGGAPPGRCGCWRWGRPWAT